MKKRINKESSISLHIQIRNEILGNILNGILKPGEKLPSENELSRRYDVSRTTVRLALTDLFQKGFIYSKPGKGTFVASSVLDESNMNLVGFIDNPVNNGLIERVTVIDTASSKSIEHVYTRLQINPREKIILVISLRYANNKAIGLDYSYLPYKLLPKIINMNIKNEQLEKVLLTLGIVPRKFEQMVQVCYPTKDIEEYLNINNRIPLVFIERISFISGEVPVEYRKTYFRGDSYRLNMIMEDRRTRIDELIERVTE